MPEIGLVERLFVSVALAEKLAPVAAVAETAVKVVLIVVVPAAAV